MSERCFSTRCQPSANIIIIIIVIAVNHHAVNIVRLTDYHLKWRRGAVVERGTGVKAVTPDGWEGNCGPGGK